MTFACEPPRELQLKKEQKRKKHKADTKHGQSLFNALQCIKCEIMFINALSRQRIFCLPMR